MNVQKKSGYGRLIGRSVALAVSVAAVTLEPAEFMVDAYAGASSTTVVVATPNITLSTPAGSPAIITNGNQRRIQAVVGMPVTVDINSYDPNGYNGFVFAGITQNNRFYYSETTDLSVQNGQVKLGNAKTPLLPTGCTLKNLYKSGGYFTRSTFTWTPTQADNNTSVTLSVIAANYYYPAAPVSRVLNFSIDTVDTAGPSFSMPAEQTLVVGSEARIPVVVVPDSDNDNVLISASSLPDGATLGQPAKNAGGQWVAVLTWTPSVAQIGSSTITFQAQDAQESTVISNQVVFMVQNSASPAFSPSMQTLVTVAQNVEMHYKVAVIPDAQTQDVLITATGLPAGASLSKPVLANGQMVATLTWKPDASQIGSSFPLTFTVEDNVAGAVPVMFTATFIAAPHYSVINHSRLRP